MKTPKPTAILNPTIVQQNIEVMNNKALESAVRFRPHFKTHQSAQIGEWFRAQGVRAITVSSLTMAQYFAENGWNDITVAFPVNWLEIETINRLAETIQLGILVESLETVAYLEQHLQHQVNVWIKIDTGYGRTGVEWNQRDMIYELAQAVQNTEKMNLSGLLVHAGHSYECRTAEAIRAIYHETVQRLERVRDQLVREGMTRIEISIGDTPCCSIIEDFSAVDEIRPGAFVFYDWTQVEIGACQPEQIGMAVACTVVAVHPSRNQVILYGGSVHLSTDRVQIPSGETIFGRLVFWNADSTWGEPLVDTYLKSLSQEHGIVQTTPEILAQIKVGDTLAVLPVHCCLTANSLKQYRTLDGDIIEMMSKS